MASDTPIFPIEVWEHIARKAENLSVLLTLRQVHPSLRALSPRVDVNRRYFGHFGIYHGLTEYWRVNGNTVRYYWFNGSLRKFEIEAQRGTKFTVTFDENETLNSPDQVIEARRLCDIDSSKWLW